MVNFPRYIVSHDQKSSLLSTFTESLKNVAFDQFFLICLGKNEGLEINWEQIGRDSSIYRNSIDFFYNQKANTKNQHNIILPTKTFTHNCTALSFLHPFA
jgi:hypothetical protein